MLIDDGLLRFEEGAWRAVEDLAHVTVPPTIHLPARRTAGSTRRRGARRDRARRRRGQGVPRRRRHHPQPGVRPTERALPPPHPRAQGAHPARPCRVRGRGRLPLPPSADPGRRLSSDAERAAGRPARALRRLARGPPPQSGSPSTRRCWATTSNRRTGTEQSSGVADDRAKRLAGDAAEHLYASAVRADERGDLNGAKALLERSVDLSDGAVQLTVARPARPSSSTSSRSIRRRSPPRPARRRSRRPSAIVRWRCGRSSCGSSARARSIRPGRWRSLTRR